MTVTTRFAPSPTGLLHLGHAFSALFAAKHGDRFLIRMEDIDPGRCRAEFEDAILEDLKWLGLNWEIPIRKQSEHMDDYAVALDRLTEMGLLYPCFCTRTDIKREIEAAGYAPHDAPSGPDGPLYPGICRHMDTQQQTDRLASGEAYALRLDIGAAKRMVGEISWNDREKGSQAATPEMFGDVVLARKDTPTSYHLAVTVDDSLQGVTLVTRGEDLFSASHIHRLLQALLGYETPEYLHHPLLTDDDGHRLAKRDKAATLENLREQGVPANEVRARLGFETWP